jgi:hypothetical protein
MCTEPFLNASSGVQNIVIGTSECIVNSRNRLSCSSEVNRIEEGFGNSKNSRYEDEKKGRSHKMDRMLAALIIVITKVAHYGSLSFSVGLVLMFIYASFTV